MTDGHPACFGPDGGRYWLKNGLMHRDRDRPAVIDADGSRGSKTESGTAGAIVQR